MTAARRATVPSLLAIMLLLIVSPIAFADGPTNGRVIVHGDHVMPGESVPVTGADLDPGAVVMRLEQGSEVAVVGDGEVAADGTLEATLAVPSGFPHGYATLAVEGASQGGEWSAVVLIGPRAEGPGGGDQPSAAALDERAIAFGVMAIGAALFVIAMARHLRREPGAPPTR